MPLKKIDPYLRPKWPAPAHIKAVISTRLEGFSQTPFDHFNLADHVHDNLGLVTQNRHKLLQDLSLSSIQFLSQVHGTRIIDLSTASDFEADAAYTNRANQVCAVLTADCLPLLLCNQAGTEVAAVHAGWRGLLAGVIDESIQPFKANAHELLVWLGPAIGACHFEINEEIKALFLQRNAAYETAFQYHDHKLWADLYRLARINLNALGIDKVYGGEYCSYCDADLFYSHRRDQGQTGRMASLIWIDSP